MKSVGVAENIAAATGKDLAEVQMILGKATMGQTKGLKTLGIQVEKGATAQDIFTAANAKYAGIADELANSTSGKFTAAQIGFNEQIEALGYRFLPAVSQAMEFLGTNVLPFTDKAFTAIGDAITSVAGEVSKPGGLIDSVMKVGAEIFANLKPSLEAVVNAAIPLVKAVIDLAGALWGDGNGPLANAVKLIGGAFKVLLDILKPVLDTLTAIIKAITDVTNGMNNLGKNQNTGPLVPGGTNRDNFYSRYAGSGFVPPTSGANSPIQFNAYLDGKQVASSISKPTANNVRASTGARTGGR
jgi:phage-related protein